MAARVDSAHVTATLLDENTMSVNGTVFVRQAEDEVLLRPASDAVAPRLRCSNCGFERQYTFWYQRLGYQGRVVSFCPGCGLRIAGVVGTEVEG
ncbi:hypothetical protein [Bifidobacterium sp.]|uniref:hypothetical protein n=1 Tax=Bifidobacterium sp. TaxID=41200 RepID=UPI003868EE28